MATTRKPAADLIVYLAVRLLVCVVQGLTWRGALALARALAWIAFRVDRRHRQVALDNVRRSFGHLDERARDRLVRASYLHLATMLIEMIRLPRLLHKHNVDKYARHHGPEDLDTIRGIVASGRTPLVLSGHFGNWEILSYVSGLVGFPAAIVARRLDNPHLERFLARMRRRTGHAILDKTEDYAKILDTLARGIGLGIVGDQDAGPRGLFVEFLGRPASTYKSIALLSLEYQAPILVMGAARVGTPMKYRVYLEDVIWPEEYADRTDATREITKRYTAGLERMVRRHPEQYFWLHRRWKTQPQPKQLARAA